MNATVLIADLHAAGITVRRDGDQLQLDAPSGSLTPDLLEAVKSCKVDLLELLKSPDGSGAGSIISDVALLAPARATPVESIAQTTRLGDDPKVGRELDRFFTCAIATPDGSGLYDPAFGPEMPSGYVVPHPSERPPGVPRGWTARSWIRHLKYMGNACAALNPEQSADYLSKAEHLEDHCNV